MSHDTGEAEQTISMLKAELKLTRQRLRALEAIYDRAPIGLAVIDTDLRFIRVNQRLAEINGLPVEAHLGQPVHDVVPDLTAQAEQMLRHVLETGEPVTGAEISGETPAEPGRLRHWVESWRPVHDDDGRITGVNISVEEVTAQKEAEAALRESEARFRASQELLPDGFSILRAVRDQTGDVVDFVWAYNNPAALQLLHAEGENLAGQSLLDRMPAHRDHPDLFPRYVRAIATGEASSVEMTYEMDGRLGWYRNAVIRVDAETIGVLFRDITARKTAELESQRLASIVENASDFIGISDLSGSVTFVNESGRGLVGLRDMEEVRQTRIQDYFDPDDRPRIEAEVIPTVLEHGRWTGELTFRNMKTGRRIPVIYDVFRIDDPVSGEPTSIATVTRDITERKLSEDRLRESEERLRAAILASPFPTMLHAEDGEILELSRRWTELTGYSRDQIKTHFDWFRLAYPDAEPEMLERLADELRQEGEIRAGEASIRTSEGATRIWDFRNVRLGTLPDGRRLQISAASDVTERREAERNLRKSERRLNAVLNNATMAVFMIDEHNRCIYMNAAAVDLTGYSLEETRGRSLHDVIHHTYPDGRPYPLHECPIDRALPEDNQVQGEEVFVHKDGHFYPVAFTASPIRSGGGKTIGTVLEVRDIRKEKEDAARLETMIGELNHRVKNSLATVQSIVWQGLRGQQVAEEVREAIEARLAALSRSHDILTRRSWSAAPLRELAMQALEPFGAANGRAERFRLEGPDVYLRPKAALALSMALHELATNALKYGAFSVGTGALDLTWRAEKDGGFHLSWRERGGPPVQPPRRKGFGSKLIERGLALDIGGSVSLTYDTGGVICEIGVPPENTETPAS